MPSPVPVAQDCYNSGDRWLPGEEARRCKCALYCPSDAGLPGKMLGVTALGTYGYLCLWPSHLSVLFVSASPVQIGSPLGSSLGDSHSDPSSDHPGIVAIYQDPQAPGPPRTGVCHL